MHLLLAMEQRPAFVQPVFVLSGFLVTLSGAQHTYQSQNELLSVEYGNIHQILRNIKNDIDEMTNLDKYRRTKNKN